MEGVIQMTISAQDIANYFIELASKTEENDLTNLKLQKLLYFAQGKYLAKNNKPLFDEPIEAWELGPVVRSIYKTYKYCGPYPITVFDKKVKRTNLPYDIREFLDYIWDFYGKYSARYLVDETHKKNTPWSTVYTKSQDNEISTELMTRYFATN